MELLIIYLSLTLAALLLTLAYFLAFIAIVGPPFVPTPQKTVDEILKKLHLKKGMVFYDLGCGDGRVVRSAVKHYGVTGIGVDLNPFLIFYCRIISYLQGLGGTRHSGKLRCPPERIQNQKRNGFWTSQNDKYKNLQFHCRSFYNVDLFNAEIIYMYPVPMVIPKLVTKFENECKKGTIIISYCFEIKEWKDKLAEEIIINRKPVFFYRLLR